MNPNLFEIYVLASATLQNLKTKSPNLVSLEHSFAIWCSHLSCASHVFHRFCFLSPFTAFLELDSNQTKCQKIHFINLRKKEQKITSAEWNFEKKHYRQKLQPNYMTSYLRQTLLHLACQRVIKHSKNNWT